MTLTELAHMRGVLGANRFELEKLLRRRDGIAIDSNPDMLDQIQRVSECEMAFGNLERESAQLRQVLSALRRIQLGTFGICLGCEEDIGMKRLAALPWAELCLACREASERNQIPVRNAGEIPLPVSA